MATSHAQVKTLDVRSIGGNYRLDKAIIKGSSLAQEDLQVFEHGLF